MRLFLPVALCFSLALPSALTAHQGLDAKLEALNQKIQSRPQDAELLRRRVQIHRILRDHDAARAELKRLRATQPGIDWLDYEVAEEALVARDLQSARSAVDRYLTSSPPLADRFAAHLLRAKIQEQTGHFDAAVSDYRSALALDDSVTAYLRSANLLVRLGRLDEAATVLRRGMSRLGAVTIRRRLVDVERSRGETDEALRWIDGAIEAADVKTTWLLLRAEVLADLDRPTDAHRVRLRALEEADRLMRKRRSALALRDRARVLMSVNRPTDAIRDLEAALRKSPTMLELHQLLAKAKSLSRGGRR